MKSKKPKRKKDRTNLKAFGKKHRASDISKVIENLHSDFSNSELEEATNSVTSELDSLLLEIEQLRSKSINTLTNTDDEINIRAEINDKILQSQKLISINKLLRTALPFNKNSWLEVQYQNRLNLLSDKVKMEPGDALCSVNVVIEGSAMCSQWNMGETKKEMYFVSLLHLLETCVLHERIWISEPYSNNPLREKNFAYGYFSQLLQIEGVLQAYSGITRLTDTETLEKRIKLYSAFSSDIDRDNRLIQDIAFSETARMKYIPDSNGINSFHNFTEDIKEKLYEPLLDSVYGKLKGGLSSQFNEISNYVRTEEIFIPPITAIILNRASKLEEIPEVTFEIRKKFLKTRVALMEYEDALMNTNTSLKKRLKILSDIHLINQELTKPYEYLDSFYINEWTDIWEFMNDIFDGEISISKLTSKLLGKPLAKVIKNMRLRNVAYLFDVRRKIYATNSHNELVTKFLPNADLGKLNYYFNIYGKSKTNDTRNAG